MYVQVYVFVHASYVNLHVCTHICMSVHICMYVYTEHSLCTRLSTWDFTYISFPRFPQDRYALCWLSTRQEEELWLRSHDCQEQSWTPTHTCCQFDTFLILKLGMDGFLLVDNLACLLGAVNYHHLWKEWSHSLHIWTRHSGVCVNGLQSAAPHQRRQNQVLTS
jgi:hypothetical protein